MHDALIIAPIAALAVVDFALALLKRGAGAQPASPGAGGPNGTIART